MEQSLEILQQISLLLYLRKTCKLKHNLLRNVTCLWPVINSAKLISKCLSMGCHLVSQTCSRVEGGLNQKMVVPIMNQLPSDKTEDWTTEVPKYMFDDLSQKDEKIETATLQQKIKINQKVEVSHFAFKIKKITCPGHAKRNHVEVSNGPRLLYGHPS